MTDEEWLTETDDQMLWESDYLWGRVSTRKFRLYAVAWCRRIWDLYPTDQCRRAVDLLELVADGQSEEEELESLTFGEDDDGLYAGLTKAQSMALSAAITCVMDQEYRLATTARSYCHAALREVQPDCTFADEYQASSDLIRELFPSPANTPSLEERWLTPAVTALAQRMYEDRDFSRMPMLAGMLEEAGCSDNEILAHCRGQDQHVRGCWVVDLVLGRC